MSKPNMKTLGVIIDGKWYHVEPYPWDKVEEQGPSALRKNVAYLYDRYFTKGLFPYRGIVDGDFSYNTAEVGIWFKKMSKDQYKKIIIRPRNAVEKEMYRIGREKDFVSAVLNNEYTEDQFMDVDMSAADSGTDVFMPPMHTDDDALNMLMKTAIRLKGAPFEPYGKRLQALAVDKKAGTERSNAKNNGLRGLRMNRAMSSSKFMEYGDAWQTEAAFIIKDAPGAMHKMKIPEGKMLVIYPSGLPFEINQEDLIDVSDIVAKAISQSMDKHSRSEED